MEESFYSYMNLGITHHLLNFKSFEDPAYHLRTLRPLLAHPLFQIVDLFVADDETIRKKEITLIKKSDKEIIYNAPLPTKRYGSGLRVDSETERIFYHLKQHANLAIQIKASKLVIPSSPDCQKKREEAKKIFAHLLYDLARYVSDNSEMKIVLEPSDRDIDKKCLLGPIEDSVEVLRRVREKDVKNLGLMVDMAHLPLLGESFEYTIKTSGNLLWHVHIGNCILQDKNHAWYGDKHPPIGFPGGEHRIEELTHFLQLLLEYDYLKKTEKNSVSLEVRSFPNKTAQETISQQLQLLENAWKKVSPRK